MTEEDKKIMPESNHIVTAYVCAINNLVKSKDDLFIIERDDLYANLYARNGVILKIEESIYWLQRGLDEYKSHLNRVKKTTGEYTTIQGFAIDVPGSEDAV